MRLDFVYLLGSLWGGGTVPQVCAVDSYAPHIATAPLSAARQSSAVVTAFVNVNVIPMDTERVLLDQTVLVAEGRITALGPSGQVPVPAGAVRIDGRGKYLMPGLADMHVHRLVLGDIRGQTDEEVAARAFPYVASGITSIRYLHEEEPLSPALVQRFKKGEVLGPRLYASGIEIREYSMEVRDHTGKPIPGSDHMAERIAAAKAAGYDLVLVNANAVHARHQYPAVDSLLQAARRLGVPVAAHDHATSLGAILAMGANGGSAEHLAMFRDTLGLPKGALSSFKDDTLPLRTVEASLARMPALAAIVKRAGLWVTPTLNCMERKYTPPPGQLRLLRGIVRTLHDAGVGLLLSGDDGLNAHGELSALLRAGLTPYQALVVGTRNAAQYFGTLDSSGTVAVGKWADLMLLYHNPLENIRHTREPDGVMIAGRWLDRAELDQRLLALPRTARTRSWIRLRVLNDGIDPFLDAEQREALDAHVRVFEELSDSMATARAAAQSGQTPSQRRTAEREVERVQQQLAKQLGAMREHVRPEQYTSFDMVARVWLREQARQGQPIAIAGIAPAP